MRRLREFLPFNLQQIPLYGYVSEILQWVSLVHHEEHVDKIKVLYDIMSDSFDADYMLYLLGADDYRKEFLTSNRKKALGLMVSNLYEVKGTKKGIDYIFQLLDWEAQVFEWFWVNERHAAGDYRFPEEIEPCSIIVHIAYPEDGLSVEDELRFYDLINDLLWVCVFIWELRWNYFLSDVFPYSPTDEFQEHQGTDPLRDYPWTADSPLIGPPNDPAPYGDPESRFFTIGDGTTIEIGQEKDRLRIEIPLAPFSESPWSSALVGPSDPLAYDPGFPYVRAGMTSFRVSGPSWGDGYHDVVDITEIEGPTDFTSAGTDVLGSLLIETELSDSMSYSDSLDHIDLETFEESVSFADSLNISEEDL